MIADHHPSLSFTSILSPTTKSVIVMMGASGRTRSTISQWGPHSLRRFAASRSAAATPPSSMSSSGSGSGGSGVGVRARRPLGLEGFGSFFTST